MSILNSIKYASTFSTRTLLKKLIRITKEKIRDKSEKKQLSKSDLRIVHNSRLELSILNSFNASTQNHNHEIQQFLNHDFDVLGSGLFHASYAHSPAGFEDKVYNYKQSITSFDSIGEWLINVVNTSHLPRSKYCWHVIKNIHPEYTPIDWQCDYKSGFKWNAKEWFKSQGKLSAGKSGVDIKCPWELSRLQHIPRLALISKKEDQQTQKHIIQEVICQLLDFVMANPIGMGVNFNCPMDVGIRNANILLGLDTIKSVSKSSLLTIEIESIICDYVASSAIHILQNLEHREGLTSNHYLGNVMGVLFAGAYLQSHPSADSWLLFGLQETESCMTRQFFNDGTNFEGSTSYHRLSAEMMVWAAGLVLVIPKERIEKLKNVDASTWTYNAPLNRYEEQDINSTPYVFSKQFWTKLIKAAQFSIDITNHKNEVVQFGDNDSGRFMKLSLKGELLQPEIALNQYMNLSPLVVRQSEPYFDENHLDHSGFISAIWGLLGDTPLPHHKAYAELELFKSIGASRIDFKQFLKSLNVGTPSIPNSSITPLNSKHQKSRTFDFSNLPVDFINNTSPIFYPDFGIVILSNKDFHLTLAGICNPNQHHSLGHSHNDKLSVELEVKGENILYNPGTYVYTPNPSIRHQFRSVKSHNTVSVNGLEQNTPLPGKFGLFNLKPEVSFELIKFSQTEIFAQVKYRNVVHQRQITIEPKKITIHDCCNLEFEQHWNEGSPHSNGYGKRKA